MEKGIITVSCVGNSYSGPTMFSITSFAPWMLTMEAMLRGDGSVLVGTSVNAFPSSEGEPPLVYGEEELL
nr:subtilisin-like protease SBT4.11 [Tanacetum cinerariifolium]